MADAAITKKPSANVQGLSAPKRATGGSYTFSTSWKTPSALTSTSRDDRATNTGIYWWIDPKDERKMSKYEIHRDVSIGTTSDSLNLNDFWANRYVNGKVVDKSTNFQPGRNEFYPHTDTKVERIAIVVTAWNPVGVPSYPWPTQYAWIKPPRKPTISVPAFNAQTGEVSATITTNAGQDLQERYDTRYQVIRYTSSTKKTETDTDSSSTATSISALTDVAGYAGLGNGYVKITFKAWARGLAGDSGVAERTHVVAYPATATIEKLSFTSTAATGTCVLDINTNNDPNAHPVDGVKLEMLRNTDISTADAANLADGWTEVGMQDDGQCTAMACSVADIAPEAGKKTWLRIKSWHDNEDVLKRYSSPVRCTKLETAVPTAADDTVTILSAEPNVDGTQAVIVLGHKNDDSDETELSWAKDYHDWKSNEQPETFMVTWDDDPRASYGNATTWPKTQTVTVKGLDGGVPYFFRARRHSSSSGVYGPLCNSKKVTPQTAPGSAYLTAPAYVTSGSAITYAWSVSADKPQTSWKLMCGSKTMASGTNKNTTYKLPASKVGSYASGGTLTAKVSVAAGGDYTDSNTVSTAIVVKPTLSVSTNSTLASQPLALSFTTNTAGGRISATVRALGSSGDSPTGFVEQLPGDVVWTYSWRPTWTASGSSYTATMNLPSHRDFRDGASYEVEATVTDPTTGLVSETATATFTVTWSHQAPAPSANITVTSHDVVDSTGKRTLSCDVYLPAPTGSSSSDVYDVYRVTPDGVQLAASGIARGSTVTDEYAPLGNSSYRIAVRTWNGDLQWDDYGYSLPCNAVRIDWDGNYVELPYNLKLGDGYFKDFESRRHLDGSISGYWNDGVSRKSTVSTDIVRDVDAETLRRLRELGQYAGPAYIRMPSGDSFQANVTVENVDSEHSSTAIGVSISAERVALTDEFAIGTGTTGGNS